MSTLEKIVHPRRLTFQTTTAPQQKDTYQVDCLLVVDLLIQMELQYFSKLPIFDYTRKVNARNRLEKLEHVQQKIIEVGFINHLSYFH